jgi:hypothetical protein
MRNIEWRPHHLHQLFDLRRGDRNDAGDLHGLCWRRPGLRRHRPVLSHPRPLRRSYLRFDRSI